MTSSLTALLEDFIGLYSRDTLERWCTLFLPGFVATATNEDTVEFFNLVLGVKLSEAEKKDVVAFLRAL